MMRGGGGGSPKTTWPGRGRRSAPPSPPTVTPPSSTMLPLEVLSSVLFRPGMKFAGRIFIPGAAPPPAAAGPSLDAGGGRGGDDGPDNNAYELTILMGVEDPLGNGYTLVGHRAYGDEQVGFAPLLRFYIIGGTSKHASLTCFFFPPFWLTLGSSHSSENRGCRRAEARRMRRR